MRPARRTPCPPYSHSVEARRPHSYPQSTPQNRILKVAKRNKPRLELMKGSKVTDADALAKLYERLTGAAVKTFDVGSETVPREEVEPGEWEWMCAIREFQ